MGSGRYARLALQMLGSGAACVTLVDLYATVLKDREHKSLLMEDCAVLGLGWDDVATRVRVLMDRFSAVTCAIIGEVAARLPGDAQTNSAPPIERASGFRPLMRRRAAG